MPQFLFALTVAAAGWYYLLQSDATAHLANIEAAATNRLRAILRRVGGAFMLLLGIALAGLFRSVEPNGSVLVLAITAPAVLLLLPAILILGLIDLRLTLRLRQRHIP